MGYSNKVYLSPKDRIEIINRDKKKYIRYVTGLGIQIPDAEDIYQNSIIYLFESEAKVTSSSVGGYFRSVIQGRTIDFRRKRSRENKLLQDYVNAKDTSFGDNPDLIDLVEIIDLMPNHPGKDYFRRKLLSGKTSKDLVNGAGDEKYRTVSRNVYQFQKMLIDRLGRFD